MAGDITPAVWHGPIRCPFIAPKFVHKSIQYQSKYNSLLHKIQFSGDLFRIFLVIFGHSREQTQGNQSL